MHTKIAELRPTQAVYGLREVPRKAAAGLPGYLA
jgi:hypothetical protein